MCNKYALYGYTRFHYIFYMLNGRLYSKYTWNRGFNRNRRQQNTIMSRCSAYGCEPWKSVKAALVSCAAGPVTTEVKVVEELTTLVFFLFFIYLSSCFTYIFYVVTILYRRTIFDVGICYRDRVQRDHYYIIYYHAVILSRVSTHVSVNYSMLCRTRETGHTSWARRDKTDDHIIIIEHTSAISMDRSTLAVVCDIVVSVGWENVSARMSVRLITFIMYTHNTVYASSRWGEIKYRQFDRRILNHWNVFDRRANRLVQFCFSPRNMRQPPSHCRLSSFKTFKPTEFRCSKSKKMFTSRSVMYSRITVGASYKPVLCRCGLTAKRI